jgi:DNA-binding response OmpR family regulator
MEDYLTKSSSIDYLIVRIQMLFRRINELSSMSDTDAEIIQRGDLTLNSASHVATWKDTSVSLTINQLLMLQELVLRPGRIKTASKLMMVGIMVVEPNTIVYNVKIMRKKFREVGPDFHQISAEHGKGKRWME